MHRLSATRSNCHLAFEHRSGRTVLVAAHAELPLVVQRPIHGPAGEAVVVILTPAGALFDGDRVLLDVTCGPGVDVTLATASATKLNRCRDVEIQFDVRVEVASSATFRYLPHELIPFRETRYCQRISIDLQDHTARAWLLEVVGAGQAGAPFTYTALKLETSVRLGHALTVRERFAMAPGTAGQLRGYSHFASLLALGPDWDRSTVSDVNRRLSCYPLAGASVLPAHGMVVKALGTAAQTLREPLLDAVDCPAWLRSLLPP